MKESIKKAVTGIVLILFLACVLSIAFNVVPLKAEQRSEVRNDSELRTVKPCPIYENNTQYFIENGYSQPQASSVSASNEYENKTSHEGDIIVEGNETFVIKNCEYTQIGNREGDPASLIMVKDNATFIISNATLILTAGESCTCRNYWIIVRDNATFKTTNAEIKPDGSVAFYLHNNSKIILKNTIVSYYNSLRIYENSNLQLQNSTLMHIYSHDTSNVQIENSKMGSLCCLNDSNVHIIGATVDWLYSYEGASLQIMDTVVGGAINLDFGFDSDIKLSDLNFSNHIGYWNLYENHTIRKAYLNVTIQNTTFTAGSRGWVVSSSGDSRVILQNSRIRYFWAYDNSSVQINHSHIDHIISSRGLLAPSLPEFVISPSVLITNSEFEVTCKGSSNFHIENSVLLGAHISQHSHVYIEDSIVKGLKIRWFYGSIYIVNSTIADAVFALDYKELTIQNAVGTLGFDESVVRGDIVIGLEPGWVSSPDNKPYVYGNVSFIDTTIVRWYDSVIKRNFNTILRYQNGMPARYVLLHLFDENGTLVWSGTTDHYGVANFNITYNDYNYTAPCTLKVYKGKGEYAAEANVTFLTETPIIFQLEFVISPILFINTFKNDVPTASNITVLDENKTLVETIENVTSYEWLLPAGAYYIQVRILYKEYLYVSHQIQIDLKGYTKMAINFLFGDLTVSCVDTEYRPLKNCTVIFIREDEERAHYTDNLGLTTLEAYYGNWIIKTYWMGVPVGEMNVAIDKPETEVNIPCNVGDFVVIVVDQYGDLIRANVTLTNATYGLSFSGYLDGIIENLTFTQIPLIDYTLTIKDDYETQTYTIDASQIRQIQIQIETIPIIQKITYIILGMIAGIVIGSIGIWIVTKRKRKSTAKE